MANHRPGRTGVRSSALALCFGALLLPIGCFNSDELAGADDEGSTTSTDTGAVYNDDTDTIGDDNWDPDETGPFETTCRDAIDCLITCMSLALVNNDPEPDLSCFIECDMGLSVDEAYYLFKLSECIVNQCAESGECGPDSTDESCLLCIAAYANDPEPPGCLEEAAACE